MSRISTAKTILEDLEQAISPQEAYDLIQRLFLKTPPAVSPKDTIGSYLQKCVAQGTLNSSEANYVYFHILTERDLNSEYPPLPSNLEEKALKSRSDPLFNSLSNKDSLVVGAFKFNSKEIVFLGGANPFVVKSEVSRLSSYEQNEVVGFITAPFLVKKALNADVFVPYTQKKKRKSSSLIPGQKLIKGDADQRILAREGEKLFHALLEKAVQQGATDIHIRPLSDEEKEKEGFSPEEAVAVTFRVRMSVKPIFTLTEEETRRLRAYFLSELPIEEKPFATDDAAGTVILKGGKKVRYRFSQVPTPESFSDRYPQHSYAIRLHKTASIIDIDTLGMPAEVKEALEDAVQKRAGIIIISGATGSGKSTTILSALKFLHEISGGDKRIFTLEDPVEVKVPGLLQTQVNEEAGYSFAEGLRSALRHDPDVIFVGEVRDRESAELLLQAAITGHLVLTTLHAFAIEDIPGRLKALGINPEMLINASLLYMEQARIREFLPGALKKVKIKGRPFLKEPENSEEILKYAKDRVLFSTLVLDEEVKERLLSASAGEIRQLVKLYKKPKIKKQIIELYREGRISTNTFNEFIPIKERKEIEEALDWL